MITKMDRKSRYLHESQLKISKKGLNCALFYKLKTISKESNLKMPFLLDEKKIFIIDFVGNRKNVVCSNYRRA
jgi:hypothetical protein